MSVDMIAALKRTALFHELDDETLRLVADPALHIIHAVARRPCCPQCPAVHIKAPKIPRDFCHCRRPSLPCILMI
jgi:hypothetical protein